MSLKSKFYLEQDMLLCKKEKKIDIDGRTSCLVEYCENQTGLVNESMVHQTERFRSC